MAFSWVVKLCGMRKSVRNLNVQSTWGENVTKEVNSIQEYWRNQRNRFTTYASKNVMSLLQAKFYFEIMSQIWDSTKNMPGVCRHSSFNLGDICGDMQSTNRTRIWKRRIIFQKETESTQDEESSPRLFISHYVILWKILISRSSSAAMSISRRTFVESWILLRIFWIIPTPSIYSRGWLPWPDIFLTKLQFHSPGPHQCKVVLRGSPDHFSSWIFSSSHSPSLTRTVHDLSGLSLHI
jgi:hypothetical protein